MPTPFHSLMDILFGAIMLWLKSCWISRDGGSKCMTFSGQELPVPNIRHFQLVLRKNTYLPFSVFFILLQKIIFRFILVNITCQEFCFSVSVSCIFMLALLLLYYASNAIPNFQGVIQTCITSSFLIHSFLKTSKGTDLKDIKI